MLAINGVQCEERENREKMNYYMDFRCLKFVPSVCNRAIRMEGISVLEIWLNSEIAGENSEFFNMLWLSLRGIREYGVDNQMLKFADLPTPNGKWTFCWPLPYSVGMYGDSQVVNGSR